MSHIFKHFFYSKMAQITYPDISIDDMAQAMFMADIPDPESRESSILVSGCDFCLEQSGNLYDCGHCRAVTYCCGYHFLWDRESHQ
jgi:hypothetical protein